MRIRDGEIVNELPKWIFIDNPRRPERWDIYKETVDPDDNYHIFWDWVIAFADRNKASEYINEHQHLNDPRYNLIRRGSMYNTRKGRYIEGDMLSFLEAQGVADEEKCDF